MYVVDPLVSLHLPSSSVSDTDRPYFSPYSTTGRQVCSSSWLQAPCTFYLHKLPACNGLLINCPIIIRIALSPTVREPFSSDSITHADLIRLGSLVSRQRGRSWSGYQGSWCSVSRRSGQLFHQLWILKPSVLLSNSREEIFITVRMASGHTL
jgi:hypothetical protein